MRRRRLLPLLAVTSLLTVFLATGCQPGKDPGSTGSSSLPMAVSTSADASPTPSIGATEQPTSGVLGGGASPTPGPSAGPGKTAVPSALGRAQQALATLTLQQKVGQVLMVSAPVIGADQASLYALTTLHVGNVFLKGRSYGGVAAAAQVAAAVAATVGQASTGGIKQFIATDQEGGLVQTMTGPGFSVIPSGIEQSSLGPESLHSQAMVWGQQLAATGVNLNLAPVLDVVPSPTFAPLNAPIGHFGREYGFSPDAVSALGMAASRGWQDGGVQSVVKHFPGLGRVKANTDTAANVVDAVTTRSDPYLKPFQTAVNTGNRWIMVSNALYTAIDANNIAPFSSTVIQGMLRGDLGFRGVVMSDDLCDAAQLGSFALQDRGVNFLNAGGTMVLCTNQLKVQEVYEGLLNRAVSNPSFADKLDAAALKVLEIKAESGLL
ncbi:glycoside hydrolase family 3 N-terminal domain-containing protein [Psychromicrobium xiongbiense]|uniref:glycoside hydrolase family 3 N-terminal domain-containing protein n=1 Tax=Psychromicrobium xiongbiense TaxID=3051184 RepID=UPI002555CDB6|nr:glycoside hydrolase family 3 N-terminal domain-containing protein [Psychromicrobium sp. YIM S02556]